MNKKCMTYCYGKIIINGVVLDPQYHTKVNYFSITEYAKVFNLPYTAAVSLC